MKQTFFLFFTLFTVWALDAQTVTFSKRIDMGNLSEVGWSVIEVDDGYVVWAVGAMPEFNNYYGAMFVKFDFFGNVQWSKRLGQTGKAHWLGYGKSFHHYKDGYIGCGTLQDANQADGYIVRYNEFGDTLWLKSFGGPRIEAFYNCVPLANGNIVAAGSTQSLGDTLGDFYLVVADSSGNLVFEKKYGGGSNDGSTNVDTTNDGGFVLGGGTFSSGQGSRDNLMVKTDNLGTLEWYKTFGTVKEDCGLQVRTSRYGGYYVWGCMDTLKPAASGTTPYVAKLDSIGNIVWRKFFTKVTEQTIWDFEELPTGDIVFLGIKHTYDFGPEEGWIVKMDSSGNILWEKMHKYLEQPTSSHISSWFRGFRPTSDGGFIITGMCRVGWNDVDSTGQDIWLLKLDSLGNYYSPPDTTCPEPCDTTGITEAQTLEAKLYPNPTNGILTIELPNGQSGNLELYNLLGQNVFNASISGTATLQMDLPQGVYIYRIDSGGKTLNGKLMIE